MSNSSNTADTVYLLIDGKLVDRFISYEIDADMYCVPAAFQIELAKPGVRIRNNMQVELYVNDILEFTGTIDRRNPSYDKQTRKNIIIGRDLMGWPVDACCTVFGTIQDKTLKQLAERLLADMPFVDLKSIFYQENIQGNLKVKKSAVAGYDTASALSNIEPPMRVFEVLKEYARSRGLLFYCEPRGRFVFGKPAEGGAAQFHLVHRKDGKGNNVLTGALDEDYSRRYSQITIVSQPQVATTYSGAVGIKKTFKDPTGDLPPGYYKPYVHKDETGAARQDVQARTEFEKMRWDGFRLLYTVQGHNQTGKNWTINEICSVVDEDEEFDLNDTFLITGRTFVKSKELGTLTRLRLGYKGSVV